MQLRLPRASRPVAACPRCVYRLRERHLRAGRCPNCELPLRGAPPELPELPDLTATAVTVLERGDHGVTDSPDVFDALDLDPDDATAQAWLARARAERDAGQVLITALQQRIAELEQQIDDFVFERGQLMALVDSVLRKS